MRLGLQAWKWARVTAMVAAMASVWSMAPAAQAACSAKSGERTTALVELFTSEGCSSCPPADRWLTSTFAPAANLNAIPLAFHVDYWDRLGWKDRFATSAYTDRQHAAMRANRATFVYTPQVLVQGKSVSEWNGSGKGDVASRIASANSSAARAEVTLEAVAQRGSVAVKARAAIPSPSERKDASLFVALAQSGFVSDVRAGENTGVRLAHDHVVRAFHGGIASDTNGMASLDIEWPVPADGAKTSAVVAFVQNVKTGEVLQTLSLPLSAQSCALSP